MAKNLDELIKGKKKEEEKKTNKDIFSQEEREMLKTSILKVGMKMFLDMEEFSQAEVELEGNLKALDEETRKKYFAEVSERADIDCKDDMEIMAEDAIAIKRAVINHDDFKIDPTSGRLEVENKSTEEYNQELNEEEDEERGISLD